MARSCHRPSRKNNGTKGFVLEIKISCCPVPKSSVDHVVPARGEAIADPYRHTTQRARAPFASPCSAPRSPVASRRRPARRPARQPAVSKMPVSVHVICPCGCIVNKYRMETHLKMRCSMPAARASVPMLPMLMRTKAYFNWVSAKP
jgi:hypothetical protein